MSFIDILNLALRNLRQARLRATLTTMGVLVGVAVIVTMVSFGLGLQRNMLARFGALDLFNEIQVFGQGLSNLAGLGRDAGRRDEGERRNGRQRTDKTPSRILDDAGVQQISQIPGVAYVEPNVNFGGYVRSNGKVLSQNVGGANIPNASSRFSKFAAGRMISSPTADEAVITERFARDFGYENPGDAVGRLKLKKTKRRRTFLVFRWTTVGWMNRLPICKRTPSKLLGCSIPRSKRELGREVCVD
jgi:ABC-type lipoprotein release transport system permease subunit